MDEGISLLLIFGISLILIGGIAIGLQRWVAGRFAAAAERARSEEEDNDVPPDETDVGDVPPGA
jgi:hypothetical protein